MSGDRKPADILDSDGHFLERARDLGRNAWLPTLFRFWTTGVLILLVMFFSVVGTNFLTRDNLIATTQYANTIIPLAIAETFVIVSGGIDLSVGAVLGFTGMAGAMAGAGAINAGLSNEAATLIMVAVGLGLGIAAGLVNGLLITKASLPPFIVTLGTSEMLLGGTNIISNGLEVNNVPPDAVTIGTMLVGNWVPLIFVISLLLVAIFGLVLAKTRFGVRTYALGSNRQAAIRSGVAVDRHVMAVYVIAGLLSGVSGLMLTSRFAVATTSAGTGYELTAIAAVVIGGGSLYGGRGTVVGSLIGALIIGVLLTGLLLAGVLAFWQVVFTGAIIIVAVFVDQLQTRGQQS